MTQREVERLTGRIALGCWCLVALVLVALAGFVSTPPPATPQADAGQPAAVSHAGKHSARAARVASTPQLGADRWHTEAQLLGIAFWIAIAIALAATSWWRWRRKQRVRAEIRAEAWGRSSLESRLRDGRAAGV